MHKKINEKTRRGKGDWKRDRDQQHKWEIWVNFHSDGEILVQYGRFQFNSEGLFDFTGKCVEGTVDRNKHVWK